MLLPASCPARLTRAPAATVTPETVPRDEGLPSCNTPWFTASAPDSVFTPERTSVPVPDLVSPAVPARMELMVATLPAPSGLTVMVGEPPSSVRMLPVTVQPAALEGMVSPNTRLPMVRSPLSVTVVSAVRFKVLKLAVKPDPSAGVAPDQFKVSVHSPDTPAFQTPSAARAPTCENKAAQHKTGGIIR